MSAAQYRHFAKHERDLASQWVKTATATEDWTLADPVGAGEAQSVYATSNSGLRGIAKPDERAGGAPRGAHEKIASDLAYHLGFPVPPVTLWTGPDGKQFSISLFAFPQALTWDQAAAVRTPELLASVAPALAACYVFHNWIGDQDHNGHGGNLLIDADASADAPGIAAIDHAYSMTHSWTQCPAPFAPIPGYYVPVSELPLDAIADSVTRVQQLREETLRNIVERVPEVYLSSERGRLIIDCLLLRREELASLGR